MPNKMVLLANFVYNVLACNVLYLCRFLAALEQISCVKYLTYVFLKLLDLHRRKMPEISFVFLEGAYQLLVTKMFMCSQGGI